MNEQMNLNQRQNLCQVSDIVDICISKLKLQFQFLVLSPWNTIRLHLYSATGAVGSVELTSKWKKGASQLSQMVHLVFFSYSIA
jgi:hypothetical protein